MGEPGKRLLLFGSHAEPGKEREGGLIEADCLPVLPLVCGEVAAVEERIGVINLLGNL